MIVGPSAVMVECGRPLKDVLASAAWLFEPVEEAFVSGFKDLPVATAQAAKPAKRLESKRPTATAMQAVALAGCPALLCFVHPGQGQAQCLANARP